MPRNNETCRTLPDPPTLKPGVSREIFDENSRDDHRRSSLTSRMPVGIEIFDDVFSQSADVIDYLENLGQWELAQVTGAVPGAASSRTSTSVGIPFLSFGNPPLIHEFVKSVWQRMSNYAFVYGIPVYQYEHIIFNRYAPGEKFDAHPDYFAGSNRVFSAVFYLNSVAAGGTTRFTHFDFEVEARAGRLVIFPANYLFTHEGTAPTSEIKYSAAFWARA